MTAELWSQLSFEPTGDALYQEICDHLDETLSKAGWSERYQVLQQQPPLVQCTLSVGSSQREALATSSSLKQAWELAFVKACARFGIVDEPIEAPTAFAEVELQSQAIEEPSSPKLEAQEHINRLMEQLKEQGLGKEAALIMLKFGGYGKTLEESRKLYSELRTLGQK